MFPDLKAKNQPFVIAEVGQNHQGNLETALEYIRVFAFAGADAIKFQTRDNKLLFSEGAYNKNYNSENAFAKTYGEHREKLELKTEWVQILKKECEKNGVLFMSTPFEENSLRVLIDVGVDLLKVASFDLGNVPFLSALAESGKPVVLSSGGGQQKHVDISIKTLLRQTNDIALLHCVSEYPCPPERLGLSNIKRLIERYPDVCVGLSDHFNGILSGPVAHLEGAIVFEKHVTLNRTWKGTDHAFSLTPEGFRKFVRDIKRVKSMFAEKPIEEVGSEAVFKKLGKSITARTNIEAGETLTLDNITGKIFEQNYIPIRESGFLVGSRLKKSVNKGDPILSDYIEKK